MIVIPCSRAARRADRHIYSAALRGAYREGREGRWSQRWVARGLHISWTIVGTYFTCLSEMGDPGWFSVEVGNMIGLKFWKGDFGCCVGSRPWSW